MKWLWIVDVFRAAANLVYWLLWPFLFISSYLNPWRKLRSKSQTPSRPSSDVVQAIIEATQEIVLKATRDINRELGILRQQSGIIQEQSFRPSIRAIEAPQTAEGEYIDNLGVVANMIAVGTLAEQPIERMAYQVKLCEAVAKAKLAARFLMRLAAQIRAIHPTAQDEGLKQLASAHQRFPFINPAFAHRSYVREISGATPERGIVHMRNLGCFIGELQKDKARHAPLRDTLVRIKKYLESGDASKLADSAGPGVCLALFADEIQQLLQQQQQSGPRQWLPPWALRITQPVLAPITEYKSIACGQHELELDVRGGITVINSTAIIWVGEIKSSRKGTATGKEQLLQRLGFLEWAVRVAEPHVAHVIRTGKLYLAKGELRGVRTKNERLR